MSAEEFGARSLKEVEVVGVDEILHTLRIVKKGEDGDEIGIPQIDALICAQSTADDALLARYGHTSHPKPVIELASLCSGAGKTHFVYLIAALAVLPKVGCGRQLLGRNSAVIVIDTDDRFDVNRLAFTVRQHVRRASRQPPTQAAQGTSEDVEATTFRDVCEKSEPHQPLSTDEPIDEKQFDDLVHSSLRHVHIIRPQSLQSLAATLARLGCYLVDTMSHLSGDRRVSAILLDSASAFYWQHRADEDAIRLRRLEGKGDASKTPEARLYTQLLHHLHNLQRKFDCYVIYTTHSNPPYRDRTTPAGHSGDLPMSGSGLRPLLPASWYGYPTLRLLLQRARVSRFAIGMGAKDAWTDRDLRWDVISKGRFTVSTTDTEGGEREVFDLVIASDGVHAASDMQPALDLDMT